METCAELGHGEVLNSSHPEWPLLDGVIYGDKTLSLKLAKRLVCGVKHLPLRLRLKMISDTQIAVDVGVLYDPTLFINGKSFIEGLVAAEEITAVFEKYLSKEAL